MTSRLSKWLALARHEKLLFFEAWIVLFSVRLIYRAIPLQWLLRLAAGDPIPSRTRPPEPEVVSITRAIDRASAYVPQPTCLVRSLAACVLLRFAGLPHQLIIGVHKDEMGGLSAHAWVLSEGKVVSGGLPDLADYTPFPIGSETPRPLKAL